LRGKTLEDQLLFDSEIERTTRKNNSKNRKKKQLKQQQQEGTSVSFPSPSLIPEEPMAAQGDGTTTNDGSVLPCHNSPRRLA